MFVLLVTVTGSLTNGYLNGQANGHANGYANGHANGNTNGRCPTGDASSTPAASVYVFDADDASSVPRRALARLLADANLNVNTNVSTPAQTLSNTETRIAQDGSVLTNRARPPTGASGLVAKAHVAGAGGASSNPVPGANVNGVSERSTAAPLYLTRRSPDSLSAPQAARAMNGALRNCEFNMCRSNAYSYLQLPL